MRALSLPEPLLWGISRLLVRPVLGRPIPISLQRAWLSAMALISVQPSGVRSERAQLADVPTVFFRPEGTPTQPRTVLYLHGGAFITGSARTHGALAAYLAQGLPATVAVAEYRLAPEHPYPAGRDDVLCAYKALLDAGTAPEDIVLAGDSVGAVLVIDLLRDLVRAQCPTPRAAVVFSPAVALGAAAPQGGQRDSFLRRSWIEQGWAAYGRVDAGQTSDPILGDTDRRWCTAVPWYVQYSGDELLAPVARDLIDQLHNAGARVQIREDPGAFHVLPLAPGLMSRARESITECGRFLGVCDEPELGEPAK